jgi:hypothetical protein
MKKIFLTTIFAFIAMITSAQFMAITTLNKVEGMDPVEPSTTEVYAGDACPTTETEDSWNVTDKIGIGYQVNEKLMVGVTKDGEDAYELLGRYDVQNGIFATCIYNYKKDSEDEMTNNMDVGIGYSMKVWKNLYIDPNYTMPVKEDEEGNREGSFNLSFSYKF